MKLHEKEMFDNAAGSICVLNKKDENG